MKTTPTITCDTCREDLNYAKYACQARIVLSCERMNIDSRYPVYAMMLPPDLERDYHFCNIKCLDIFAKNGFKVKSND